MPTTLLPYNVIRQCFQYWQDTHSKYLRWGQYFLNTYYPNESNPKLYYEENPDKAMDLIRKEYIDWEIKATLD